ncbi:type VII secretion integral membrane protein EccD [Antrihabitans cavernicola]|uniref:type VII secretion integral membrane protein EccD n=1 Tax=Antrihabitans cavernicola TaxID=2495913 RepID=UPI0033904ED8
MTILAQRTQVDLAVPLDVPVALLIPGIVDMITSHGRTNEFDDDVEHFEPKQWVLARVGQPPLSSTLSLGEHGVKDGELLMLESASATAPAPLFDDIMYNVASADADTYRRWTPASARTLGSILAAVATVTGCFSLLWSGAGSDDLIGGICALFVTLLLLIAGTVASRVYYDQRSALVLCGCALPTAFSAGLLFVQGDLSWAHTLLATVTVGATAVLALRISGVGLTLFTGVAAVAFFVAPAAFVGLLTEHPLRAIGAVLAGVALAALVFAPRIAMLFAKLPLPAVPAPGTSIDPLDDDPSDHRAMPTFAELSAKSERARKYLTGLIAATVAVTVGGALTAAETASSGGIYWPGTAFAIVCAVVLMFRGRTYSSAEQAITLIAGGAVVLVALLIGAAIATDAPLIVFGAALVLAVAALVLGVLAPNRSFSPPMRRAVELLEYACIAAVVPLVCWVADLYGLMRGL